MCISLWNVTNSPWIWDILWSALEQRLHTGCPQTDFSSHLCLGGPEEGLFVCLLVNWIGNPEISHQIQLFLKSGRRAPVSWVAGAALGPAQPEAGSLRTQAACFAAKVLWIYVPLFQVSRSFLPPHRRRPVWKFKGPGPGQCGVSRDLLRILQYPKHSRL